MKILRLVLLQLKVNFGLSALKWYFKNDFKRFLGSLGLAALVVVGIGPIFILYLLLVREAYNMAAMLGQAEIVLSMSLVLSSFLVLLFGLAFVMSVFYFSRDLSFLVPLPLVPRDILGAKFTVVLIYDYLTILPFYLPALWIYGVNSGAGPLYWVAGAIVFLLVPVIPLAVASTFLLFLMSFTNLSRRRDTFRLIGLFAFLALILAFNFFITSIPPGEEIEFIEKALLDEQGLVSYTTRVYPPALFATRALTAGGVAALQNLAYYLGASLAGIACVLFVGQKIFYRGLIGGAEIQGGKVLSREALQRKTGSVTSPAWAIALREIKYLLRTPIYLFNSLAMVAVLPLVMVIPMLTSGGLEHVMAMLLQFEPRAALILGGAGFIGGMALFAPAASSSFSREGKLFWISQVIPVYPQMQIHGKVLYSYLVTAVTLPVVVLISLVMLPLGLSELLLVLFAGLVLSLPAITISLLIDLLRPYLHWDSPQKAIKQNINVVLGMVAGGGLYYLLFLAGRAAYLATGEELPVYLVVLGGAVLAGAAAYGFMLKIAPARYRDIAA